MSSYDLILASGSPRRSHFLRLMGLNFKVEVPDIDEEVMVGEDSNEYVSRMSREKAFVIAERYPDDVVLAADTIVSLDNKILGKPKDREDAKNMLRLLSGRSHEVITAVTLARMRDAVVRTFVVSSQVTFNKLSDELIETYVASGESDDKSGSYAVQGIASMFVESVTGSVSSIAGLPLSSVRIGLEEFGIKPRVVNIADFEK